MVLDAKAKVLPGVGPAVDRGLASLIGEGELDGEAIPPALLEHVNSAGKDLPTLGLSPLAAPRSGFLGGPGPPGALGGHGGPPSAKRSRIDSSNPGAMLRNIAMDRTVSPPPGVWASDGSGFALSSHGNEKPAKHKKKSNKKSKRRRRSSSSSASASSSSLFRGSSASATVQLRDWARRHPGNCSLATWPSNQIT